MTVDPRHHKHFVARRGEILNRISDECGGVMVSFPRPGIKSDRVVLKGAKNFIEAAKTRIQGIVTELESMVTIECVIPQHHHRTIMGTKGHKVQGITTEFNVQIKFPEKNNFGKQKLVYVTLRIFTSLLYSSFIIKPDLSPLLSLFSK